jgi:hypothetical protein
MGVADRHTISDPTIEITIFVHGYNQSMHPLSYNYSRVDLYEITDTGAYNVSDGVIAGSCSNIYCGYEYEITRPAGNHTFYFNVTNSSGRHWILPNHYNEFTWQCAGSFTIEVV